MEVETPEFHHQQQREVEDNAEIELYTVLADMASFSVSAWDNVLLLTNLGRQVYFENKNF